MAIPTTSNRPEVRRPAANPNPYSDHITPWSWLWIVPDSNQHDKDTRFSLFEIMKWSDQPPLTYKVHTCAKLFKLAVFPAMSYLLYLSVWISITCTCFHPRGGVFGSQITLWLAFLLRLYTNRLSCAQDSNSLERICLDFIVTLLFQLWRLNFACSKQNSSCGDQFYLEHSTLLVLLLIPVIKSMIYRVRLLVLRFGLFK